MDNTETEDFELEFTERPRRVAPMPRRARRRQDRTQGGDDGPIEEGSGISMMGAQTAANDLSRAADELLEHFDQATSLRDSDARTGASEIKGRGRIVLGSRGLHEDGSESSGGGGEVEVKIAGLMTPDEVAFKASSSEDGTGEGYRMPEWLAPGTANPTTTTSTGSQRDHECEHDGCYGLSARFIDDDRLSDDYAARGGGKKRKVPASAQQGPTQMGDRGEEGGCVGRCGNVCSEATTSSIIDTMNKQASSASEHDETKEVLHDQQSCPHVRCCNHHSTIRIVPDPVIKVPKRQTTPARRINDFERRLFLTRKAQVMGLHADAVMCLGQGNQKKTPATTAVPSKDELEELVKALEYTGVAGWEGDRVGAGMGAGGMWDGHVLKGRIQGGTLVASETTASATVDPSESTDPPDSTAVPVLDKLKWRKRGRIAEREGWRSRRPVKRGGWVPEGTFEFEIPSKVTARIRKSAHDLQMLRAKVTQLLTLTLSSSSMTSFLNGKPPPASIPMPAPLKTSSTSTKRTANKDEPKGHTRKREPLSAEKVHHANGVHSEAAAPNPESLKLVPEPETKKESADKPRTNDKIHNPPNVTVEPSADDPDYIPFSNAAGAKKGKKKKKKSAMANAANPHHVKNYVPSRRPVNPPQADMPNLVDFLSMLFFPPPTRFLNAKPGRKDAGAEGRRRETAARPGADPTDEEYVCCFCEYDLFFGSEQAMDKAVRRRKKVLERRQKAQEKAKGVMAGKGLRTKSKSGGDGGDSEEDERCAGAEKCRCAEMRAQEAREQSDDADSRGIEDTGYKDSGWIGDDGGSDYSAGSQAQSPSPAHGSATPLPPDGTDESRGKLPEVETFDLDEVEA